MKATGITRRIDQLGRVVIPIEIRRNLNLKEKDLVEIYTDSDAIIFKKYEPACIFCGCAENTKYYNGKIICSDCINKLSTL